MPVIYFMDYLPVISGILPQPIERAEMVPQRRPGIQKLSPRDPDTLREDVASVLSSDTLRILNKNVKSPQIKASL